jgi:hypothetical protein
MKSPYDLFNVGQRLRVKIDFQNGIFVFRTGEILTFESRGFVPYDSCHGYEFHSENDNKGKLWCLHQSKPPETWHDFFEPVD